MTRKPFTVAVIFWVAIILIAHFFPPPGYAWTQNSISELASQGHDYKWIMQAGLIGFGALVLMAVVKVCLSAKRIVFYLLPVALYGFFILLSGIYCAAPIDPSIPFSEFEAKLHSAFATLAGLSISLAIAWHIFIASDDRERGLHLLFLVLVIGLSALFGLAENSVIEIGKGIIQRLLYLSGFAWLVYQERMFARKEFTSERK